MKLGGARAVPSWGHHMWRRLADSACNEALQRGECLPEDVDIYMGWRLAKWAKLMRLHYCDRGLRAARARMTRSI